MLTSIPSSLGCSIKYLCFSDDAHSANSTHQISMQFFANVRADLHKAHEDEEAAEEDRQT